MTEPAAALPTHGSESLSRHVRGSTLFVVGRFLAVGFDFVAHVLMVRYLVQADFGAVAYAISAVALGASVSLLGLDKAVGRFVPIYEERGEYPRVFGTLVLMIGSVTGLGLALAVGFLLLRDQLLGPVIGDPTALTVLTFLIFLVPIQALGALFNGVLAIYASTRAIFLRRYVVAPALQLLVVAGIVVAGGPVEALAIGLVAAGFAALALDVVLLVGAMRANGVLTHFDPRGIRLSVREVFGFSMPLLVSDAVFILRSNGVVVLLEFFRSTVEVAVFRAAVPLARQNLLVMQSFNLLYMPIAARMYARGDRAGINDLYWMSAIWIAVFSFPVLAVSLSLAEPVTVLLYGDRYAPSAPILAILALGFYWNAALGFNGLTLRVYGRVRYLVGIDLGMLVVTLIASLVLIDRFGAVGAAIAVSGALILQNLLYHVGLYRATDVHLFEWRYVRIYLAIVGGAGGLLAAQVLVEPPVVVGILLAVAVSIGVIGIGRHTLQIGSMFPELLRLPFGRWLFGGGSDA